MSRIHEALQRVAEERAGKSVPTEPADSTGVATGPAIAATDFDELEHEAFPIELSERRPRPAAPPVAATDPGTTDRRGSAKDNTLPLAFERLDARYAGKIVIDQEISGASREQYRRLAATLHHAQAATGVKVVMVTSALMGEGKTLTSSNLALTLSESYQKHVLLVDADLRRPAVHTVFRVRNASGLAEGLAAGNDGKVPVQQLSNHLGVLAAGQPTSDPIAGLTSPRMRRLLDEAREAFDWVIVDTPPVALLTDANLLASMVDCAVVVVRASSTPWDLVQRAVTTIGKERIIGVVLNRVTTEDSGSVPYEYYYLEPQVPRAETPSSS